MTNRYTRSRTKPTPTFGGPPTINNPLEPLINKQSYKSPPKQPNRQPPPKQQRQSPLLPTPKRQTEQKQGKHNHSTPYNKQLQITDPSSRDIYDYEDATAYITEDEADNTQLPPGVPDLSPYYLIQAPPLNRSMSPNQEKCQQQTELINLLHHLQFLNDSAKEAASISISYQALKVGMEICGRHSDICKYCTTTNNQSTQTNTNSTTKQSTSTQTTIIPPLMHQPQSTNVTETTENHRLDTIEQKLDLLMAKINPNEETQPKTYAMAAKMSRPTQIPIPKLPAKTTRIEIPITKQTLKPTLENITKTQTDATVTKLKVLQRHNKITIDCQTPKDTQMLQQQLQTRNSKTEETEYNDK